MQTCLRLSTGAFRIKLVRYLSIIGLAFLCATPASASNFTWRWTNRSGETLNVQIFSKTRDHVWPATGRYWIVPPDHVQYANPISCHRGEKICYGAWSADRPDVYWGVGRTGNEGCTGCCYTCVTSQSHVIGFDPAPVSAAPESSDAEGMFETWVSEGGASLAVIGSLTVAIEADEGLITFENGKTLGLVAVPGVDDLWKVTHPSDPVLKNGNRLCGRGAVSYVGIIMRGRTDRFLKPFDTDTQPSSVGGVFPGGGSCALYPMFEKTAHGG